MRFFKDEYEKSSILAKKDASENVAISHEKTQHEKCGCACELYFLR